MERKNFGYTLIELMVVLAIMSFIAAIAFYGLRNYDNSQQVVNTQKDFVNLLRSTQNKVTNGADGLNTQRVDIPSGAIVTPSSVASIYFNNSNLPSSSYTNPPIVTVKFTNGSTEKMVTIESDSSGLFVNRIYAN